MPDILIGNIRGPQGETGPANQVLAQTYDYCVSDNGETIPTGPWQSTLPELHQGDWVWARCTITMQQGADVVMYAVGYVGRDGEFNGIELVRELENKLQALEDRTVPISKGGTESTTLSGAQARLGIKDLQDSLDKINDYTTGENLIRGTQKFPTSSGSAGVAMNNNYTYYPDRFNVVANPAMVSFEEDDDGFTDLVFRGTGSSSVGTIAAPYYRFKSISPTDTLTVSFEIYFSSNYQPVQASTAPNRIDFLALVPTNNPSGSLKAQSTTLDQYGVSYDNRGVWQKAIYHWEPGVSGSDVYLSYAMQPRGSAGEVRIRKFMVQRGKINNPVWIAAPGDIDRINDITTDINLLQGTRDFLIGTERDTNVSTFFWKNGFVANASATIIKDDEGFANWTPQASGGFHSSYVTGIKQGETYTAFFEVMFVRGSDGFSGSKK